MLSGHWVCSRIGTRRLSPKTPERWTGDGLEALAARIKDAGAASKIERRQRNRWPLRPLM